MDIARQPGSSNRTELAAAFLFAASRVRKGLLEGRSVRDVLRWRARKMPARGRIWATQQAVLWT